MASAKKSAPTTLRRSLSITDTQRSAPHHRSPAAIDRRSDSGLWAAITGTSGRCVGDETSDGGTWHSSTPPQRTLTWKLNTASLSGATHPVGTGASRRQRAWWGCGRHGRGHAFGTRHATLITSGSQPSGRCALQTACSPPCCCWSRSSRTHTRCTRRSRPNAFARKASPWSRCHWSTRTTLPYRMPRCRFVACAPAPRARSRPMPQASTRWRTI